MFENRKRFQLRRLLAVLAAALVSLALLFSTSYTRFDSPLKSESGAARYAAGHGNPPYALAAETVTVTIPAPAPTAKKLLLKETSTSSFKENLRPELKYITAWPAWGWNNQVMQFMNMIYLGLIAERIPIIPPFTPKTSPHVQSKTHINFGEIFDMPRFQKEMGKTVLEWYKVKNPESETLDSLGCWNLERSVWKSAWPSPRPDNLRLDISYTLVPDWVKLKPGDYSDYQSTFWALASLGFADTRPANITPELSPIQQTAIPPDEHLLCFDNVYFLCAFKPWEFSLQYFPAWRFVGRHMHWTAEVRDIADIYTRKAFDIGPDEQIPPYISIHARRGDFKDQCAGVPVEDCFAPLSAFARRVDEVKAEILSTKGISVDHIIMTSDEQNSVWWEAVHELGWAKPDHSQTVERYGAWYPVFIDGVIQSAGLGFVGTHMSTVSIIADRRVFSWQDGAVRTVYWGRKGADDHI